MTALFATKYFRYLFKGLDVKAAMIEALNRHAVQIEGLNLGQLIQGIDSTGSSIAPPYTDFTKQIKQSKGQPTDRVTLKDTGDFYESVYLKVFKNVFDIRANDPKTKDLKQKYGNEILGLTDENIKKVAQIIKPDLKQLLLEQIRTLRNNVTKEQIAA